MIFKGEVQGRGNLDMYEWCSELYFDLQSGLYYILT